MPSAHCATCTRFNYVKRLLIYVVMLQGGFPLPKRGSRDVCIYKSRQTLPTNVIDMLPCWSAY